MLHLIMCIYRVYRLYLSCSLYESQNILKVPFRSMSSTKLSLLIWMDIQTSWNLWFMWWLINLLFYKVTLQLPQSAAEWFSHRIQTHTEKPETVHNDMKNISGSSRGPHSEHDPPCRLITTTLGVIFAAVTIYSFLHSLCGHSVILNKHLWYLFKRWLQLSSFLRPIVKIPAARSRGRVLLRCTSILFPCTSEAEIDDTCHTCQALKVSFIQKSVAHSFKKNLWDPIIILWIILCLMQTASATRGLGMDRITVKTDRISKCCLSCRNIPEGIFPG